MAKIALTAGGSDLGQCFFGGAEVIAVIDHDEKPVLTEFNGDASANAPGGAGYQCYLFVTHALIIFPGVWFDSKKIFAWQPIRGGSCLWLTRGTL